MSSLADFVAASVNKCIDLNEPPGDCQCVALADAWANDQGLPLPLVADAKDFVGAIVPGWTWIANTPDNQPQPGDLVVWDTRIGVDGHIALCTGPVGPVMFTSLDQNWVNSGPNGSPAVHVDHNYFGVAGWLRLTGGDALSSAEFDQLQGELQSHDGAIRALQTDDANSQGALRAHDGAIRDLQARLAAAETALASGAVPHHTHTGTVSVS